MKPSLNTSHIYFITGAAGFIGANLLEKVINTRSEVHILIKKSTNTWRISHLISAHNLHIHFGDLLHKEELTSLLEIIQPTVIYHLATHGAYSAQNEAEKIFETNVLGTLHLLEASKTLKLELFVNTSSSSEYGSQNYAMSENDLPVPDSFYAISKLSATHLCQYFATVFKIPVITFRLFSVYGPWEAPNRLMPTVLYSFQNHLPLEMVSPETARDFIYIDDVVDLYLSVEKLSKQAGEVLNLGTGSQTSLKEVIDIAQRVTQKLTDVEWLKMPAKSWDKPNWVANMARMKSLLNWQSTISLETGLLKMSDWLQTHQEFYLSLDQKR